MGPKLVKDALENAVENPFFGLREPGLSVKSLAKEVLEVLNVEDLKAFSDQLCKLQYCTFAKKKFLKRDREAIIKHFLSICQAEDISKLWHKLIQVENGTQITKSLLNFMLDRFLVKSIQHLVKPIPTKLTDEISRQLSPEEQQTIRYVAGYLAFSIKKCIRNPTSPEGKTIIRLIDSWSNSEDESLTSNASLLEYTKKWVTIVNRGGLFEINDSFYLFIEKVEKICRSLINLDLLATYCGENLLTVLLNKLENDVLLDEAWHELTRSIEAHNDLLQQLRNKIFVKWINIRAHAFIKSWLQINKLRLIKKGKKHMEQSQPALRKTLSKQSCIKTPTKVLLAKKRVENAKKIKRRKLAKLL